MKKIKIKRMEIKIKRKRMEIKIKMKRKAFFSSSVLRVLFLKTTIKKRSKAFSCAHCFSLLSYWQIRNFYPSNPPHILTNSLSLSLSRTRAHITFSHYAGTASALAYLESSMAARRSFLAKLESRISLLLANLCNLSIKLNFCTSCLRLA